MREEFSSFGGVAKTKHIGAAISRIIADRKFSVATKGPDLQLIRMIAGRPVTIMLRKMPDGFFWLEPPSHDYICSYSHFDYTQPESRYTRRKTVILSLVAQLQRSAMWPFISNKKFFEVNKNNHKMKTAVRRSVEEQYHIAMKG